MIALAVGPCDTPVRDEQLSHIAVSTPMRCSLAKPVLRFVRVKQLAQVTVSRQYATPTEYKPQEKDPQLGDYPQLPFISTQLRSPLGWWDLQMRRNYGEVASLVVCYDTVLLIASSSMKRMMGLTCGHQMLLHQ